MTGRCAIALLAATAASGCVSQQHEDVIAAREAYAQCVEANSRDIGECDALRERLIAAQRRYEDDARLAWGCDPESGDCPTER